MAYFDMVWEKRWEKRIERVATGLALVGILLIAIGTIGKVYCLLQGP